jgi:hypothetical protein
MNAASSSGFITDLELATVAGAETSEGIESTLVTTLA